MPNTWGSTDLQIVVNTAKPAGISGILVENELIPSPTNLNAISSVVQQKGRKRRQVKARICVESMDDYWDFIDDADDGTEATLVIDVLSVNATYMIASVGEPDFVFWDQVYFDVTWMEVA